MAVVTDPIFGLWGLFNTPWFPLAVHNAVAIYLILIHPFKVSCIYYGVLAVKLTYYYYTEIKNETP